MYLNNEMKLFDFMSNLYILFAFVVEREKKKEICNEEQVFVEFSACKLKVNVK